MKHIVYLKPITISGEARLAMILRQNPEFAMQLQNIKGWTWSETPGVWHIPYHANHLSYLQNRFGRVARFHNIESGLKTARPVSPEPCIVPPAFYQYMRLKRYSENTQKNLCQRVIPVPEVLARRTGGIPYRATSPRVPGLFSRSIAVFGCLPAANGQCP